MANPDYYAETRRIAELLEAEGRAEDAARLIDAIDGGSTSTEILMMVRHQLKALLQDQSRFSDLVSASLRSLEEQIGAALR